MHGLIKKQISALAALLFLVADLQADITLPRQAPPQAEAQTVRVWRGEQTTIPLRAHYGGTGTVAFAIVQRPEHGELTELRLLGDNRATVTYQNDGAEGVMSDGFRYVVKAGGERVSSPAEVRISVEERPPRMVLPGKVEFDEIVAGTSASRPLAITNEGGGVLEGRLSVSAPWHLSATEYRVKSGQTETVEVSFRPEEGREFVGQMTLAGSDASQTSVLLTGRATAPVRVEPDHLQIDSPKTKSDFRSGTVSLTNETERALGLKVEAGQKIEPIPEIALAPHEKKQISIVVLSHPQVPVHEEIVFVGSGFKARLRIDAAAAPAAPLVTSKGLDSIVPSPALAASAPLVPKSIPTSPGVAPLSPASTPGSGFVAVQARRREAGGWELRWARPKITAAKYRIEERFLSQDGAGELQTQWQALASPDVAESGDQVVAQIKGLEPRKLHMLRVTALNGAGALLWESPPIALPPPRQPSQHERGWLLLLGLALGALVFLRWRANRAPVRRGPQLR
jgi:hypothetical protein